MVSYYNNLPYAQKHSAANLAYPPGQHWQWTPNYHGAPNHQFLGDIDSPHSHQMYYNPHHMFHPAVGAASEWHTPASATDNFTQNSANAHQMLQQHHGNASIVGGGGGAGGGGGSGSSTTTGSNSSNSSASVGPGSGNTHLNETTNSIADVHIAEGLPSPPITVSGSEISSPGVPASSSSPHHGAHHLNHNNSPSANNNNNPQNSNNNNNRNSGVKPAFYEWMKKPAYPAQPTPGYLNKGPCTAEQHYTTGKTRTKDKYRVVYTDFQRLELEKEYCTSRYITIRRKTELAQSLTLSERQVKIWFQNRRAKERKQTKKGSEPVVMGAMQHNAYENLMESKPKLEPGLHLQHPLHSINSMAAMSMPPMSLHHHLHNHHSLAVSAAAAHSHQLHQSAHVAQMSVAGATASVGSLSM